MIEIPFFQHSKPKPLLKKRGNATLAAMATAVSFFVMGTLFPETSTAKPASEKQVHHHAKAKKQHVKKGSHHTSLQKPHQEAKKLPPKQSKTSPITGVQHTQNSAIAQAIQVALKRKNKHSHEVQLALNHGFSWIDNGCEIKKAIRTGEVVRIQDSSTYYLDTEMGDEVERAKQLPSNRHQQHRYQTKCDDGTLFVEGKENVEHYQVLHLDASKELSSVTAEVSQIIPGAKLKVPGLSRTVKYIDLLAQVNPNASKSSTHTTTRVFDISYKEMSHRVLTDIESAKLANALTKVLEKKRRRGEIFYIKEGLRSKCFHIVTLPKPSNIKMAQN